MAANLSEEKNIDAKYFILVQNVESPIPLSDSDSTLHPGLLCKQTQGSPVLTTSEETAKDIAFPEKLFPAGSLKSLTQEEYQLLFPVSKPRDRIVIYKDKYWLDDGKRLRIGDNVFIQGIRALPRETAGIIRFKGTLKNFKEPGIHFGLELFAEYNGLGTSSGSFRKTRYFECGDNCAMFLTLFQVRKRDTMHSSFDSSWPSRSGLYDFRSTGPDSVREEDRVVWISDNGPESGTVKWVGNIPDLDPDEQLYAGVAFDNPIGKGTGRFHGQQLFRTKKNHASLVPAIGLLREEDFKKTSANRAEKDDTTPARYPGFNIPPAPEDPTPSRPHPTGHSVSPQSAKSPDFLKGSSHDKPDLPVVAVSPQPVIATSVDDTAESFGPSLRLESSGQCGPDPDATVSMKNRSISDGPEVGFFSGAPVVAPTDSVSENSEPDTSKIQTATQADTAGANWRNVGCDIKLGDVVEVLNPPRRGTVRWLSQKNDASSHKETSGQIAGLEMDSVDPKCYTDGSFEGTVRFKCDPKRAFFIYAYQCRRVASHERSEEDPDEK